MFSRQLRCQCDLLRARLAAARLRDLSAALIARRRRRRRVAREQLASTTSKRGANMDEQAAWPLAERAPTRAIAISNDCRLAARLPGRTASANKRPIVSGGNQQTVSAKRANTMGSWRQIVAGQELGERAAQSSCFASFQLPRLFAHLRAYLALAPAKRLRFGAPPGRPPLRSARDHAEPRRQFGRTRATARATRARWRAPRGAQI